MIIKLKDNKRMSSRWSTRETRHCWSKSMSSSVCFQIFQYLELRDLLKCELVCSTWRAITQSGHLWSRVGLRFHLPSPYEGLTPVTLNHGNTYCTDNTVVSRVSPNVSDWMSLAGQLLCRKRLDHGRDGRGGSAEEPALCYQPQPAWMHVPDLA